LLRVADVNSLARERGVCGKATGELHSKIEDRDVHGCLASNPSCRTSGAVRPPDVRRRERFVATEQERRLFPILDTRLYADVSMNAGGVVEPIWRVIEVVLVVRFSRAAWISRSGFRERRWARQKDQLRDRVIADEHERTRSWN
jgi:hypothetical protein